MDDFLGVHLDDYLGNPLISEKHNFDKKELLEAIKLSDKFIYDEGNHFIKLKYKAKRRIIVFRDIPKEKQTREDIEQIIKFAGNSIEIQRIESSNEIYYVYFKNEEDALEVFKQLEKIREEVNFIIYKLESSFHFFLFCQGRKFKKRMAISN